jgi:hypothetical protein
MADNLIRPGSNDLDEFLIVELDQRLEFGVAELLLPMLDNTNCNGTSCNSATCNTVPGCGGGSDS